jgi:hypothetical protein
MTTQTLHDYLLDNNNSVKERWLAAGYPNIEEVVLLHDEATIWMCKVDQLVFKTAHGANMHRVRMHKDFALSREEELEQQLKELEAENTRLVEKLQTLADIGVTDHSQCYEFVGQSKGNEGKAVDVIRKDGFVYRAYPL